MAPPPLIHANHVPGRIACGKPVTVRASSSATLPAGRTALPLKVDARQHAPASRSAKSAVPRSLATTKPEAYARASFGLPPVVSIALPTYAVGRKIPGKRYAAPLPQTGCDASFHSAQRRNAAFIERLTGGHRCNGRLEPLPLSSPQGTLEESRAHAAQIKIVSLADCR